MNWLSKLNNPHAQTTKTQFKPYMVNKTLWETTWIYKIELYICIVRTCDKNRFKKQQNTREWAEKQKHNNWHWISSRQCIGCFVAWTHIFSLSSQKYCVHVYASSNIVCKLQLKIESSVSKVTKKKPFRHQINAI